MQIHLCGGLGSWGLLAIVAFGVAPGGAQTGHLQYMFQAQYLVGPIVLHVKRAILFLKFARTFVLCLGHV